MSSNPTKDEGGGTGGGRRSSPRGANSKDDAAAAAAAATVVTAAADESPASRSAKKRPTTAASSSSSSSSTPTFSSSAVAVHLVESSSISSSNNSSSNNSSSSPSSPSRGGGGGPQSSRAPQDADVGVDGGDITKTHRTIEDMICGTCVLCRMPRCERCFICQATMGLAEEERGYCIRKLCCAIPIEFKLQPMTAMGFPRGWRFAFDDPQKLVHCARRIFPSGSMAGLRITSPPPSSSDGIVPAAATSGGGSGRGRGRVYNSLEAAFANVPHPTAEGSTRLVEGFLGHVSGSSGRASMPDHFLVGRRYCAEFSNGVLFGRIAACVGDVNNDDDGAAFFVVEYDEDALAAISKGGGGGGAHSEVRPIQLIGPELAWGGCILYERKACSRRDARSVIRNIDRATRVETWVAPDLRYEEVVDGPDGSRLPRLTVFSRGYKFVFETRASAVPGEREKKHHGVYASCTILQRTGPDQEVNLKPGELIDLGVFSPLRDEDRKSLPAFAVKNYVHNLRPGRWAVVAGDDDSVYDLTDDSSGDLHAAASDRVLSYVRRRKKGSQATVHARLDPAGNVHMLFGVRYSGNWTEYEGGMQQLVPIFCGGEVEVTTDSRQHGLGKNDSGMEKCLQSIGVFQTEDIVAGIVQLALMCDAGGMGRFNRSHVERCGRVIKCLAGRARKLRKMFADIRPQSDGIGVLDSALARLEESKELLVAFKD